MSSRTNILIPFPSSSLINFITSTYTETSFKHRHTKCTALFWSAGSSRNHPNYSLIHLAKMFKIVRSVYTNLYLNLIPDMEKDQIFPRTHFVNNKKFRKKHISKFLTITRIIVEIIIYRL